MLVVARRFPLPPPSGAERESVGGLVSIDATMETRNSADLSACRSGAKALDGFDRETVMARRECASAGIVAEISASGDDWICSLARPHGLSPQQCLAGDVGCEKPGAVIPKRKYSLPWRRH